ncbi:MAG: metallophosphoesterase [Erysipelotrichaceae bacterium]|jgi:Icc-related predicted phosphoesterase
MIYITGDTHGNIDNKKLNDINFPIQKTLTKNDYVIVVGDMGIVWDDNDQKNQDFYNFRNFTTLFIDGNHENFDKLYSFEEVDFKGGKAHKISDSIYHLKRGQVFNINNLKIFTLGGANSIDYMYRIPFKSWWPQELPSEKEYEEAFNNLEKHNYKVDIVLTHSAPYSYLPLINPLIKGNKLNKILDKIEKKLDYKAWFLGHYHKDIMLSNKIRVLYNDIISIDENLNIERYEGNRDE